MAKTKSKVYLAKKDWALIALTILVLAVGWYAYQTNQARMLSEKSDTQAWLAQQVQINKLKACIDENTRPCDISPQIEQ